MCEDPSHTITVPLRQTKDPPRETQVPLRLTECSLRQMEGLHELMRTLAARQSALSDQHRHGRSRLVGQVGNSGPFLGAEGTPSKT